MRNENGSACVCVQGNLGKLCPAVGPHGPWVTSGPSPYGGAGWRTSASSWPGCQVRRRNLSRSPLSTAVVVATHLFLSGRLVCCSLPVSASRLSGEDRSEGVISSEDPSIFVPHGFRSRRGSAPGSTLTRMKHIRATLMRLLKC